MFGQLASSQTLTRRFARSLALSRATALPGGIRTRIHHGLRGIGVTVDLIGAAHKQPDFLAKNPAGYCGGGGTGVSCPIGLKVAASA